MSGLFWAFSAMVAVVVYGIVQGLFQDDEDDDQ